MKKLILLLSLFAQSSFALEVSEKDNLLKLINETILKNQKIENTGIGISVFNKNEIILETGFGLRDREKNLDVDEHTLFAIGSTTKAFTSLGIKILENRNLLNLNDSVLDHLTDFKLSNELITKNANIEDLLTHRIGLPRHDLMWLFTDFSREENFKRMQYLDFPKDAELKFRKEFHYNNFFYMVAGKIIEAKSNTTYENFIQKEILNKLSMNETFLTIPSNQANLAEPYYLDKKVPHKNIDDMAPAGSIYSSAHDMTKWIQSFLKKSWENQDDLFKARIGLDNEHPSLDYGYGLAWMTNTMNDQYHWYFHDGAIYGFSALVLFSPELDLGVVILVNQNGASIGNSIVSSILKYAIQNKTQSNKALKFFDFKLKTLDHAFPLTIKENAPNEMTSSFEHPAYGKINLVQSIDKNYLSYYGNIFELTKKDSYDYYNYVFTLPVGGESYPDFPIKIENTSIEIPFQNEVDPIKFFLK